MKAQPDPFPCWFREYLKRRNEEDLEKIRADQCEQRLAWERKMPDTATEKGDAK